MTSIEGGPNLTISGVPTVIDAIQKAGGVTQNTDLKNIKLHRKLPGNNNEYKVTNLDLYSLVDWMPALDLDSCHVLTGQFC